MNTRDPLPIRPPGSAAPDFMAGQKLAGCYVMGRRLEGSEGAAVWLAYDEVRGRELSLYFIPNLARANRGAMEAIRALVEEARRLVHPNILRVYDLVEDVHWSAITMDRFDGETLWTLGRKKAAGCFEAAEIGSWLLQICAALEEAHRVSMAHGDLSAANIYIQNNGRLLLANFGIKRALRALHAALPGDDIQAFGNLLHTLLAGSPAPGAAPVPTSEPLEVEGLGAMKIPGEALSIGQRRAALRKTGTLAIPAAWEKVAAACLEKSSELQPAGMAEIAMRLAPEKAPIPSLVLPNGLRHAASKPEAPAFARPKMPPIGMLLSKPKPSAAPLARPEPPPVFIRPQEAVEKPPVVLPRVLKEEAPPHFEAEKPAASGNPSAPRRGKSKALCGLAAAVVLCGAGIYAYCDYEKQKAVSRRSVLAGKVLKSQGAVKGTPEEAAETLGSPPAIAPSAGIEPVKVAKPEEPRGVTMEARRDLEIAAAESRYEEKMKALAETMKKFQEAAAAKAAELPAPDKSEEPAQNEKMIEPPKDAALVETKAPPTVSEKAPAKPFENSLGMKFAPVGKVLFSIWPTRVSDFEAFAIATKYRSRFWKTSGLKQTAEHPVVYVSWLDAVSFCKWLTDKEHQEGALPANQSYRLPHDLEWSAAAGLGEESGDTPAARDMGVPDVYPWGGEWPPTAGAGNYAGEETRTAASIKGYTDGFALTSPVGSFLPNAAGLYDMGGNVWQWCLESWNAGDAKSKVLRGASWSDGRLKPSLLSSCRIRSQQNNKAENFGFRCVIETAE